MNKFYTTTLTFATLLCSSLTAVAADGYVPEQIRNQSATYNETDNTVTITGKTPTQTEYDWDDWYEPQKDLPYISYILIERHEQNTAWPDNAEVGRIENPALGEMFTFTDTSVDRDIKYDYRLTCFVDGTQSQYAAFANVYTGIIPGEPIEFSAAVADHESNVITFTITAPETSAAGTPLTGTVSLDIMQYINYDENLLHTIENAEPGKTYSWQHTDLDMNHAYHYRGYARIGKAGKSLGAEADCYTGLDIPGQPLNLVVTTGEENATITWQQPAKGVSGGNYNPAATTYTITRTYNDGTKETAASNVTGTEYVDNPGFDEACTITYSVVAINSAGTGHKEAVHAPVSFGRPASLPFAESFASEKMDHKGWTLATTQDDPYYTYDAWHFVNEGSMYYLPADDTLYIAPCDNDGGLASCWFYGYCEDGQTESLISPSIDVADVNDIEFTFNYFETCAEASPNVVEASISRDNGEWEKLFTSDAPEEVNPDWKEVKLPVSLDGKASTIRVRLDAIRYYGPITNVFFDNIKVAATDQSAIRDTLADGADDAPATYYNIQGIRIDNPTAPGIYIVKKGNTTSKVLVK